MDSSVVLHYYHLLRGSEEHVTLGGGKVSIFNVVITWISYFITLITLKTSPTFMII